MKHLIQTIVTAMDNKMAQDIRVLDISGESSLCDYFVVCEGQTERQTEAIAEAVEEAVEKEGVEVLSREGKQSKEWILLDLGDIIVHVFKDQVRRHYDLEGYWTKAKEVDIQGYLK